MINIIFKRIHNKYSVLFKFIFNLRYLFGIFFISVILFLSIPHFLDLQEKDYHIKKYLSDNYKLKLNKYEGIKYNSLPIPNIEIQNADISINETMLKISTSNMKIYPKLFSIYNYENFESKKIILIENKILLQSTDLKSFINYIYTLKKKLNFINLNIKIAKKENTLMNLEKINFSNYGYNKNVALGKIFKKKFKLTVNEDFNKIKFKLFNTGITVDINLNETKKNLISGIFMSSFLNSNLKFNFNYDDKKIKIYNSYFRNKNLSFKNKSTIKYSPFFFSNSIFNIEDINLKLIKNINIDRILIYNDLIKVLNSKNKIIFKSKKFDNHLIDDLDLNIDLIYGKLFYSKKISIEENFFKCLGDVNLLQDYPVLYFDCLILSKDKKKLLKKFLVKYNKKKEALKIEVKGTINIFNNKINFKTIKMNDDYKASMEDLKYFKQIFEAKIFDENIVNIFNYKKIKEFIIEIL